jgi:hypothetical protein
MADLERVAILLDLLGRKVRIVRGGQASLWHRAPSGALEIVFGCDWIHPKCGSVP